MILLFLKGTEHGLKSTGRPPQNHTTLVWVCLKYTFNVCVCVCVSLSVARGKAALLVFCLCVFMIHCLFLPPPDEGVCLNRGTSGLLLLLVSLFLHVLVVLAVRLQQLVPPSEGGGVVPDEVHVMEVMETGTGVERDQMERVPRDVVTTEREQGKMCAFQLFFQRIISFCSASDIQSIFFIKTSLKIRKIYFRG